MHLNTGGQGRGTAGDEDSKKDLIRKKTGYPGMEIHKSVEVEYLTFPALERLNIVTHMVTSRFGGVSTGDCASFNFSYARDTNREAVDENFRRAAGVFGTTSDAFVCSDQTHTTNIRRVEKEDAGKGVTKEKDYRDVDGLITNVPGLILGTFYADCVPLLFVDPVHHAIGCSHSGWRGTVGEMGKKTVEAMREAYGSRPEDILRRLVRRSVRTAMKLEKMWQNLLKSSFLRRDIRTFP